MTEVSDAIAEPVAWRWKGHNGKWVYEEGATVKRAMREYDGIVVEDIYSTATIAALVAERDEARGYLDNLLARIHRDGGHYTAKHGTAKAVADADLIVSDMLVSHDALATANARMAELEKVLEDLLSWFPDKPSKPEWRLEAGKYGADGAVTAARAALTGGENGEASTNPQE